MQYQSFLRLQQILELVIDRSCLAALSASNGKWHVESSHRADSYVSERGYRDMMPTCYEEVLRAETDVDGYGEVVALTKSILFLLLAHVNVGYVRSQVDISVQPLN